MRVLVTGADGFLGRQVVAALARRGHLVRALGPPRARAESAFADGVERFAADLCTSEDLERACEGVDVVAHLAAKMRGDQDTVVQSTLNGTRRLFEAMESTHVPRLVLASSLSVYDWLRAGDVLDENASLEERPEFRDGYTTAKLGQERLARERCGRAGIAVTVLRPPALWGAGREYPPTLGQRFGAVHVLFAAGRQLPAMHVENCGDAFAVAVESTRELGGIFNLIDHADVTVKRFVSDLLHRTGRPSAVIPVAYEFGLASVRIIHRLSPRPLRAGLPSFVATERFAARFRPVRIDGSRFRHVFGWTPPLTYEQCLDRTYRAQH